MYSFSSGETGPLTGKCMQLSSLYEPKNVTLNCCHFLRDQWRHTCTVWKERFSQSDCLILKIWNCEHTAIKVKMNGISIAKSFATKTNRDSVLV